MMRPYPFFRPYYPSYYRSHNFYVNPVKDEQKPYIPNDKQKKEQRNFSCSFNSQTNANFDHLKVEKCIEDDRDECEECFEIFGLKLHFDDLLIIALLFFLYQEEVKDSYLYISLILLLLS